MVKKKIRHDILREVSPKEKNKYRVISLTCGIQKNDTDE